MLTFSGCTWVRDYQVRSRGSAQLEKEIRTTLDKEYAESLGHEFPRRNDYVEFIMGRTTIDMGDVTEKAGGGFIVPADIHTVSPEARGALVGVIKPLEGKSLNAFNFANALELFKQRGMKTESHEAKQMQVEL